MSIGCDSSPLKHPRHHARADVHPIVGPCVPRQDWRGCCLHEAPV